ncbi:DUF6542 domain-containing protein [Actinomycetospora sp. CA-101289]|uniref:DUF6542 domain-containing protein n=1 Tax=Actinomycetospora sp. CA-101289 TaxID=3239893 RepID=UPI003D98E88F
MTSAREDAVFTGAVGPGERSVVRTVRGLRWWGAIALAAVLTVAGVAIDLLTSGELGVVFTACFAGGCILATAWARRDSLFVPLVQPPLLLAVAVPAVVVATGSLPRSGGTASVLLAVGGPLVNGFPTLAITAAICLALGFIRSRIEPFQRPGDDLDPDARAAERLPRDRAPRDRDPRDRDRERPRDRDPRDRDPRDRDRERDTRDRDRDRRDPRDRDPRDPRDREPRDPRDRPRRVPVEMRPVRDDRRRPAADDPRRRPTRPDDPDDEFGPGVRRVPRRVDGPDDRR